MPDAFTSRGDEELHPRNLEITFLSNIPKDLQCSVCLDIFRDPNQTACGHRFCRVCTEELGNLSRINGFVKCPLCQTWICRRTEIFPDKAIQRTVGDLQVECFRKDCVWAGSYNDLKRRHIAMSCDSDVVECPNQCRSLLSPDAYEEALQRYFEHQGHDFNGLQTSLQNDLNNEEKEYHANIEEAEKCRFFDQLFLPGNFQMFRNQMKAHLTTCRDEKVTCFICNQGGIKRKFLIEHQFSFCGKLKTFCEFCGIRNIERKNMKKHMNEFHSDVPAKPASARRVPLLSASARRLPLLSEQDSLRGTTLAASNTDVDDLSGVAAVGSDPMSNVGSGRGPRA